MGNYDHAMRRQVFSLPELMKQQYEDLEPKTRKVLSTPEIFSIQRIILTGCGDSYAAGLATKHIFELLTGIPTEVVTSIELARLYDKKQLGFSPNNPLVIAVSHSGSVARVGESVERANKYGALTLGVTSNRESYLGRSSQKILDVDIPAFEPSPGVRSYMVSVLALLLLAIRFGEVRGSYTMDTAMSYRADIAAQAEALEKMLPSIDQSIAALAAEWSQLEAFDFTGVGFDYAAAWYGHAKMFEAAGKYAMHVNTEEWLHLNFFMRNFDKIGTVMFANASNPGLSRAKEAIAHAADDLGRPTLVVSDIAASEFSEKCTVVATPTTRFPITIPLTQFVPAALLSGYIATIIGEDDGRGTKDNWSFAQNGHAVKNSEIIID
ncbi:SIS domain-containing protein [Paenibacillus eucommiae]|uniref:Glutamine--fructose-6-phosphate aminotransferase [isomerizing] n=1 Tax=Paenibacillus eucommiae TaxID=1355755 RepID=A0ABS4JBM0_9BACL|nr:SIS domain-containing protein [Paenibacillus eucommiae]MBP1996646.1 glucosamine--fructose-6-phosphate aminotransferase (isomerizing) [Paenibacillus eucommiae]